MRQIAKALDKPLELIPARYSAVRADLVQLHEVPAGLTAKTPAEPQEQRQKRPALLAREKGVPEHGAPLTPAWEALRAKIDGSLVRDRAVVASCASVRPTRSRPKGSNEGVVDAFIDYRSRCGKPADDAFRRLMARAWNGNVWNDPRLAGAASHRAARQVCCRDRLGGDFPEGLRRDIDCYLQGLTRIRRSRKRSTHPATKARHDPYPPGRTPSCRPHGGEGRRRDREIAIPSRPCWRPRSRSRCWKPTARKTEKIPSSTRSTLAGRLLCRSPEKPNA